MRNIPQLSDTAQSEVKTSKLDTIINPNQHSLIHWDSVKFHSSRKEDLQLSILYHNGITLNVTISVKIQSQLIWCIYNHGYLFSITPGKADAWQYSKGVHSNISYSERKLSTWIIVTIMCVRQVRILAWSVKPLMWISTTRFSHAWSSSPWSLGQRLWDGA